MLLEYESKAMTKDKILEREKKEALQTNTYKELYKMEKLKGEEEEEDRERKREARMHAAAEIERRKLASEERKRIERQQRIENKEEEFKMF